jgi:hypothetical protein
MHMDEQLNTYEAPQIVEIGSVHELTLTGPIAKELGGDDGFTFMGQGIHNAS